MFFFKSKAPVCCKMEPVVVDSSYHTLTFRGVKHLKSTGVDMKGCTYIFNRRSYRDMATLKAENVDELTPDSCIFRDEYGEYTVVTYISIPTFDSGDREWDSYRQEILFYDGKHIHLAVFRGGYKIAGISIYEQLLSADAVLKPLFERLAWPTHGLIWRE